MRRIAVRGIAVHEGKLLCVCLCPSNAMAAVDEKWWCLPGGKVDEGEGLEEALVREIFEETGIHPVLGKLLYVYQFTFNEKENLEFFFHIANPIDYQEVDLENTSHGVQEIEQIDFVDPKTTVILPKFLSNEDIESQIRPETPVKFFSFER